MTADKEMGGIRPPCLDDILDAIANIERIRSKGQIGLMTIENEATRLAVDHVFNLIKEYINHNPVNPNEIIARGMGVAEDDATNTDSSDYSSPMTLAAAAAAQAHIQMQENVRRQIEHNAKMTREYIDQIAKACTDLTKLREANQDS